MDIKDIILKSIYGQLTDEEQLCLDEWKTQPNHDKLYEQIRANILQKKAVEYLSAIDVERALKNVRNDEKKTSYRTKIIKHYSLLRRVAAVALLLMVCGAFWYHHEYTRVIPPVISEEVHQAMQQSKESGKQGAEVVSSATTGKKIITQEEASLYHVDDDFAKQLAEAKRITTHHDKEYWVTLDDGTLVHLNYNSRLIYPEQFGDRRDVILDGEAYFMVAKDKSRQFVVHTPQGDVKVHGTEFMVNTKDDSYPQAEGCSTTVVLVKGSVSFTTESGMEQQMQPGQFLTVSSIGNNQTTASLRVVDTTPYVAWNTGTFVFENSKLEHLMNVLAQWYDIKNVNYTKNSLRNIHFTGNLKRYGSIERIMEAIMMTCDVRIALDKDSITVYTDH